ncbi:MAG: hypothetical protein CVV51_14245 [Spirochaetae bacterium HGW-Spirochaetae-7]|jgi:hypothetical protein|nr:MAG: hypothetical protein CVV51_14245 [Spirochaetae bacterium HGW-Spirochaetae-7]
MARRSTTVLDSGLFLQLSLGVFFLALGALGLGNYQSKFAETMRFFGRDDSLRIVTAIIELVMGGFLLLSPFVSVPLNLRSFFSYALLVLWAIYILYYFIFNNFAKPDIIPWLYEVSWRCVILAALWSVSRKFMN